ncbi:MAG: hypothetical protein GY756_05970 [bacterium]|nr:hypothetical protein [bacterium]
MIKIYNLEKIKGCLNLKNDLSDLLESQKNALVEYSQGIINVPYPIQMRFPKVDGDCHIKAGFKENDDFFIVKIATGFYNNTKINLPAGDGVILAFSQKTGMLEAILCDCGFLTILRTALTAVVAANMTPWKITHIGIIGTGQVAIQILEIVKQIYPFAHFSIYGRSISKAKTIAKQYTDVKVATSIQGLMQHGGIVFTATSSRKAFIDISHISDKTNIIAVGADETGKQECDPALFKMADIIIADSVKQSIKFSDASHAIKKNLILGENIRELGNVLNHNIPYSSDLIITDLTGIAAQDIAISKTTISRLTN